MAYYSTKHLNRNPLPQFFLWRNFCLAKQEYISPLRPPISPPDSKGVQVPHLISPPALGGGASAKALAGGALSLRIITPPASSLARPRTPPTSAEGENLMQVPHLISPPALGGVQVPKHLRGVLYLYGLSHPPRVRWRDLAPPPQVRGVRILQGLSPSLANAPVCH